MYGFYFWARGAGAPLYDPKGHWFALYRHQYNGTKYQLEYASREYHEDLLVGGVWGNYGVLYDDGGLPVIGCAWWDEGNQEIITAYANGSTVNKPVLYREGTPNSDGTITWDVERTVKVAHPDRRTYHMSVCKDTNGYPWLALTQRTAGHLRYLYIYTCDARDGSGVWSLNATFVSAFGTGTVDCYIVPLTDGKLYCAYTMAYDVYGRLYSAGAWGGAENIETTSLGPVGTYWALRSWGDHVYLVWSRYTSPYTKYGRKRHWGVGWTTRQTIQAGTTSLEKGIILAWRGDGQLWCYYMDTANIHRELADGTLQIPTWGGAITHPFVGVPSVYVFITVYSPPLICCNMVA